MRFLCSMNLREGIGPCRSDCRTDPLRDPAAYDAGELPFQIPSSCIRVNNAPWWAQKLSMRFPTPGPPSSDRLGAMIGLAGQ